MRLYGNTDETDGLKQALSLARNNAAPLTVMIVYPIFPDNLLSHKSTFEKSLLDDAQKTIKACKAHLKLQSDEVQIDIKVMSVDKPSVEIIKYVLQNQIDMVIKEPELTVNKAGFKAIDMDLLRKCPAAVWLYKPIKQSRKEIKVAVAVDPSSEDASAKALAVRLLELSKSLALTCSGQLDIISCWDFEMEGHLSSNVWLQISKEELNDAITQYKSNHEAAINNLIKSSNIKGNYQLYHIKGRAEEKIPEFVKDNKIDILVMGTVARTGIQGFIHGNTAENITQNIECSLLALKPNGYVSPIKAY